MPSLSRLVLALLLPLFLGAQPYYPERHNWERRSAEQVGMNGQQLEAAIAFARANETSNSRDLEMVHYATLAREPFGNPVGPFTPRGDVTGVILRHGYLVAEWGEPFRVDMTFSATKSFLSATVGV